MVQRDHGSEGKWVVTDVLLPLVDKDFVGSMGGNATKVSQLDEWCKHQIRRIDIDIIEWEMSLVSLRINL